LAWNLIFTLESRCIAAGDEKQWENLHASRSF
jgi:hypothetical protein